MKPPEIDNNGDKEHTVTVDVQIAVDVGGKITKKASAKLEAERGVKGGVEGGEDLEIDGGVGFKWKTTYVLIATKDLPKGGDF